MNGRGNKALSSPGYTLGNREFQAISAIEGLKLGAESLERLGRTRGLSPAQRRAETIRAFEQARKRG